MKNELPDIQHSEKPEFSGYINSVGVEKVKVPFKLDSLFGGVHNLTANVEMTTDLKDDIKGISMGMLLRTLILYLDKPLKHEIIRNILNEFKKAVETDSDHSLIKFRFDLPIVKKAPISEIEFPQYYDCSFIGKLDHNEFKFYQKVKVYYGSYCPCSASLCDNLIENNSNGYPHAQRGYAELLVEVKPENIVWLEQLIGIIESSVKTGMYPILRRVDEQEVARVAYLNKMFVEDAIRRIMYKLNNGSYLIHDWIIKCVHMESIHVSDAIATSWKGIPGGFRGTYYL